MIYKPHFGSSKFVSLYPFLCGCPNVLLSNFLPPIKDSFRASVYHAIIMPKESAVILRFKTPS
ncbi:conserved protein of unknown function [Listeria monocytogenes]|nr:conserved protein of unknown function [Listeria monocytogenes]GAM94159.1 conserved protein of unknown function [Listeria monocytogenes]